MSEFGKIHAGFWKHRKVEQCSNGAIGLWAKGNAWCRDTRSAGYIPRDQAESFGTREEIQELVNARLWLPELSAGLYVGFRYNQYLEWNNDVEPDTEAGNIVRKVVPANHPAAIRKQLVRHASALISEGISGEIVERALHLWLSKDFPPSVLPSFASQAMKDAQRAATLRNALDKCLRENVVTPLKDFGYVFPMPDPPDGLNVDERREFMTRAKRDWLNGIREKVS